VYLRTKHKEQITKNAEGSTKQPMTSLRTTRPWVHGLILLTIFLGVLTAGMSWELNHGLMLALAGGLMLLSPPVAKLPTSWWWLAGAFAIFGCLVFLPVGGLPFWREELEKAGLATGHLRAVQVRLAGETLLLWVATLGVGLWIVGQRTSDEGLKVWALGFALVVAAYTLASIGKSELAQDLGGKPEVFGFFPNRNHTATFLAMGAMVSIAVLAQAIRDKRWWGLGFGAAATGVCLWGALIESESRAGLLLVVVGGGLWWLLLGKGYLGRHAWKAVLLLALLVVGGFLVGDSKIRERLEATKERIELAKSARSSAGGLAEGEGTEQAAEAPDLLAEVDFRVPVWRDTLAMIADAPWSGVGGGHFWGVFPQFRRHTLSNPHSDGGHPESDWLWMAAEAGVPAALALLGLVGSALGYGLARVRRQRSRALRAGCVIAAFLLAFHGLFDVPGHRVPLAWAAAFLFGLALPAEEYGARRRTKTWPYRVAGILVMIVGLAMLWSWWAGASVPAPALAEKTRHATHRLYRQDQANQAKARQEGRDYAPNPGDDPLEHALLMVDESLETLPLDRGLWYWKGFLALHYDDRVDEVDRAFRLERKLDPDWVGGPLRQARAWVPVDPERVVALWREALERADRLDLSAGDGLQRKRCLETMRQMARGVERLEAAYRQFDAEN